MKQIIILLLIPCFLSSCQSKQKNNQVPEIAKAETDIQNPQLSASIKRGADIYADFCVVCHLPSGKGVPKTFPPLADSDYLKNYPEKSIRAIKYGQSGAITVNGDVYNGTMAPLGLEDQEVADVMNYINNSWGNTSDELITAQEVSKIER